MIAPVPLPIQKIIDDLQACPFAYDVWEQAQQQAPFSVQFGDLPTHTAKWCSETRTIYLTDGLPNNVGFLLMELLNSLRNTAFRSLDREAETGSLSRHTFLHRKLGIEYQSNALHHQIASECVAEGYWPARQDLYKSFFEGADKPWATFESMWKHYLSHPSQTLHRRTYETQWDLKFKAVYCEKNASRSDCKPTA